jgi:arabinofuranan 3-O-arabinosyltransferase
MTTTGTAPNRVAARLESRPLADVPQRAPESVWRLRHLAICVTLAAFCFNADAGKIVPDTKIDLTADPVGFLARALQLWDPQGFAGQLQNQAYGYLFPIGPFFALGKVAHLPAWVVQRLWWSALLCAAFLGVIALAKRLGMGTPTSRAIGGVAYALSPHVISVLGPVSAEALPMCLTPWVLVPLVDGARGGSIRRAAMLSGLVVLCMGGVNAALDVAALLPALTWLLTRRFGPRMWRLTAAWAASALLACLWWLLPLLLLGRFSPPFLDYIESASTTTSVTSLFESLRGTSDWVAYVPGAGWRAGSLLLTQPALIVNSVVVVGLGLAGLAFRRCPERLWLVSTLLVGVALVTLGHSGSIDGIFAGSAQDLLDRGLAPLRNVHKFDVVIRLPLVLGLVHLAGMARWGKTAIERRVSRTLVVMIAAVAVAGTATPFIALRTAPSGGYVSLPGYWQQAARWLADQHATGRSLVIPGSHAEDYYWGTPTDAPLQPLAKSPWTMRNGIPLVPVNGIRVLDAIEQRLDSGQPSPGLADYLQRAGIRYLVVRNDLNPDTADSARPIVVHSVLAGSPGVTLAASFGPLIGNDGTLSVALDQYLLRPYPAVEIWSVGSAGEDRVEAVPMAAVRQVSGGPESLLDLEDQGMLSGQPTIMTGDLPGNVRAGEVVLTDGLQRREATFGAISQNTSAVLTSTDPLRLDKPRRDYVPADAGRHETIARYLGAKSILASSSASDPNALGGAIPADQPYSAFDGDPATYWRSAPLTAAVGQWLKITFGSAQDVAGTTVRFGTGSGVAQVAVRTDAGTTTTNLGSAGPVRLSVPPGPTASLQLTVTRSATGIRPIRQVSIAELAVPGVHVAKTLQLPSDLAAGTSVGAIMMSTPDDARPGCLLLSDQPACASDLARAGEQTTGLDRSFTLPTAGSYALSASAVPRPGPALNRLIATAVAPAVRASATSRAIADPLAGPQAAVDEDLGTGWIASPDDSAPRLTLSWHGAKTISSLRLVSDPRLPATRPDSVLISSAVGSRLATVEPDGTVRFAAMTSDGVTLRLFSSLGLRWSYDPTTNAFTHLGIGVSDVALPGIRVTTRAASDARIVTLPCGTLPAITIDGQSIQTWARTTVAHLRDLAPVDLQPCSTSAMNVAAGPHRVVVASTGSWLARSASLVAPTYSDSGGREKVTVGRWSGNDRTVAIGARTAASLLVVHENANAGWDASLNGRRLTPITVDGWQQGYLLPSGAAGTVHLSFAPDRGYRLSLLIGLVAALMLLGGALVPARRRLSLPSVQALVAWWALPVLATVVLTVMAGPAGLATGMAALVASLTLQLRPGLDRYRVVVAIASAGLYVGTGVVAAAWHWVTYGYSAVAAWTQVVCVLALATVAVATPRRCHAEPPVSSSGRAGAGASPDAPPVGS